MNRFVIIFSLFILIGLFSMKSLYANLNNKNSTQSKIEPEDERGAYYTGNYRNLFLELLGKSELEINSKINAAYEQLFYGDDASQRIYYPVGTDMGYIEDINNVDVRTEGMSYGMMIAVQLNKKNEFDRLWKWTKTYMQHDSGPSKDYFAWHCKTNGEQLSPGSASDGEEWFVTTLFLASNRWGDGDGIFNYKKEAQNILDAMLSKIESSDDRRVVTNIFNKKEKQVVFVPDGVGDDFTDPSYHLPHFYELWSKWADKENNFWKEVAATSRKFLMKAVNPETGLAPDYSKFDGTPYNPWGGGNDKFQFDAWRVSMNIAVDYLWFANDNSSWCKWEVLQSNRILNFFYAVGINSYKNVFSLDGKNSFGEHSLGLVASNAVAAIASTNENRKEFVQALWDAKLPTGKYRYYDGILYMLGLLQVSGNYRIYDSTHK
jgi:oligosaccharide reducing-end xylanase